MKKLSIMIVLVMITTFVMTGCSEKAYKDYIDAVAKTGQEKTGRSSLHVSTKVMYDKSKLSVEEISQISRYNDLRLDMSFQYDMTDKPLIAVDVYTNTGGAGMDFNYYKNGDLEFIRLPIIKKYVVLESPKDVPQTNIFSDISKIWLDIIVEDDVAKGENTIVDSEEGQVKAKVVTVTLADDHLKTLGKAVLERLLEEGFIESIMQTSNGDSEESIKNIKNNIKKTMESMVVTSMTLKAYIDFDGYLIREDMIVGLDMSDTLGSIFESVEVIIRKENWDLGKKQEIVIPEVGEDEQIKMKDLDVNNMLGL